MRTNWIIVAFALLAVLCLPLMSEAAKGGKAGGKKKGDTAAPAAAPAPVQVQATVTKADSGGVTVTLQLPTDFATKVVIDGETKTLADLKSGQSIKVILAGSTVSEIDATTK